MPITRVNTKSLTENMMQMQLRKMKAMEEDDAYEELLL